MTAATAPSSSRRPRFVVPVLASTSALAALGLGGLTLSGAFFTDETTSPEQRIGTATVSIAADTAASSAPIDVAGLLPGDSATTTITLNNDGTADVVWDFTMVVAADSDSELADALQVTVESENRAAETMSLAAWAADTTARTASQAAGTTEDLGVTVLLPATAGDELQGKHTAFSLAFSAQQSRNS